MLLEMEQETSGRVRGSGQAVSCPVQFGLDAGKGKRQTDLSAFSWKKKKLESVSLEEISESSQGWKETTLSFGGEIISYWCSLIVMFCDTPWREIWVVGSSWILVELAH